MTKKRLLSGIRPTGSLHIGHYLGVLRNWAKLQDEHECFYFIADWHTLTTKYKDTHELNQNIIEVAKDILASGIDPNKCTLYVQSAIPEVAELNLLLGMIVHQNWVIGSPTLKDFNPYIGEFETIKKELASLVTESKIDRLARQTTIEMLENQINSNEKTFSILKRGEKPKDFYDDIEFYNDIAKFERYISLLKRLKIVRQQIENNFEITYGLLGYPVLQTADILSVLGESVPVGKDQVAHLEMSRDIARRFNHIYKTDTFPEPKALLTETPSVPGVDGRKMSKSYGNDIKMEDSPEETLRKVKQMITDPARIKKTDPGNVENCQVAYKHYEIFADKNTLETVKKECHSASIGCMDCKVRLSTIVNDYFKPLREKRESLKNEKEILEILDIGNRRARKTVQETLHKVRDVMKLKNWN